MKLALLSLALLFALLDSSPAASEDLHFLTPENSEEYGYWVHCIVKDKKTGGRTEATHRTQPSGPVSVILRMGLVHEGRLHKGPFGVNLKDLQVIESLSLVVRDGEGVLLSVPLRTEVDPGNEIHLLAEFSARREAVSKMQVVFDERSETGKRKILIDLETFTGKQ